MKRIEKTFAMVRPHTSGFTYYPLPARQHAKAFNFGIAGGEGVHAIRGQALHSYGVELTLEEARDFKYKLIEEVYPELSQYLYENLMHNLARNLRKPVSILANKI